MMEKKHIYTTVNGLEVEYKAISLDTLNMSWSALEKKFRADGMPIDPPTYEIATAGGSKISEPHDETTEKTEDEQAAWNLHKATLSQLQYEKNLMLMQYIFEDGLENVKFPKDDNWLNKHRRRLVEIPEDPQKLREFYITSEVLTTPADIAGITAAVMLLSQEGKVDEATLETVLDSFRSYMGKQTAEGLAAGKKQVETGSTPV